MTPKRGPRRLAPFSDESPKRVPDQAARDDDEILRPMIEAFQRDRAKRRGQPRHPLPPDLVGPPQKKRQPFSPRREFTPRQKEIARDIADGLSYAAIGEKLGITEHTVRAHVAQIALILHEPSELSPRSRILWWMNSSEWGTARPCDGGRENALASSRVKQQHDH